MFRNIVFFILTSLTIFTMGCYDSVVLNSNQINQAMNYDKITIVVTEDDGTNGHYRTSNSACSIINDSLFAHAGKVSERGQLSPAFLKVPLSKIKYFEVEEFNAGKTILLTGGIVGTVALITALASKEEEKPSPPPQSTGNFSCPLIYTLGSSGYKLESETFAGAVFKGIERTSYDVLNHIEPVDRHYKIKLVNARQETEYVNELKLIVVDHSPDVSVIPDAAGNIYTISELIQPLRAFDRNDNDITKIIAKKDGQYLEDDLRIVDINKDNNPVSSATATFPRPTNAKTVKIIVSGLNTELAYFALERIFTLQGNKRIDWYNRLDSDPKERSKFVGWLMREGMLHFSVWDGEKWSERGVIPDVGPGVQKTQITILNIGDIKDDILKVRASYRTGLWRLDQFAVDYSSDCSIKTVQLSAYSAINEKDTDISNLIAESDSAYYVTINGEGANIIFKVPPKVPRLSRTVIAKTKGFYNQWALQDEKPQPKLVDRILSEPLYSSKYLIPLWLKKNIKQRDIFTIEN
jgi:hypothetical protein